MHASCTTPCSGVPSRNSRFCGSRRYSSKLSHHVRGGAMSIFAKGQSIAKEKEKLQTVLLQAQDTTPESFAPFGQVISATPDGKAFDSSDAALRLDQGTPRFYIMRIPRRGLTFDRITYHDKVTQCLGGLGAAGWYLVVAAPSGSVSNTPKEQDLKAFHIQHGQFVKLHQGTWHAGPLFDSVDQMDFYNLELSDTNQADHNTHIYAQDNLQFAIAQ